MLKRSSGTPRVVIITVHLLKCQAISPNTSTRLFQEITDISNLIATNQIKYWFFAVRGETKETLLFFRDINDILNCSDQLKFYFFADDSNLLYAAGADPGEGKRVTIPPSLFLSSHML